jgi:hypothetical protein
MAFSGMINVKSGQLTFGGQFEAYKRGQLERNIQRTKEFCAFSNFVFTFSIMFVMIYTVCKHLFYINSISLTGISL